MTNDEWPLYPLKRGLVLADNEELNHYGTDRGRWTVASSLGLAVFFAFSLSVPALDPSRSVFQYNCQTWQRVNGLPVNSVNAIAQTTDGRLWLGTSKGLIYFNGMDFRIVESRPENGREEAAIMTLAKHGTNGLWLGFDHGGLGSYDGKELHSLRPPNVPEPMSVVHRILEAADGTMLLAADRFAGRWDGANSFQSLLPTAEADVFSICEDSKGRVWVGTADHGLFYLEHGQLVPFPDPTLRGFIVSSLAVDPSGRLWVGLAHGTAGLRCYDPDFNRLAIPGVIPEAKALLVDRQGVLWIGTLGGGLARYQNSTFSFLKKEDGLANDRVLTLAESDDGSLWIGTVDGLTELSDVKFPILSQKEGLVTEACFAVAPSPDGGIWASTPDGASFYRDGKFSNFGADGADGFSSRWMKRVYVARNGDAYFVGARKTLDRFSTDHVITTWTNGIWPRAVTEDATGIIVAFAGELIRIQNDKLVPFRLADGGSVSRGWIENLLVARDGSLWVASDHGVCQIKDGVLHDWTEQNGLTNAKSLYLCEDDAGAVWIAQIGAIARCKNGAIRRVTRGQGLPDDSVCAIVADNHGYFWMDSCRGIFRVNQEALNAVADGTVPEVDCELFDGLDSVKTTDKMEQNYSGCRSLDGRIWFPSSKGIIMIDPARVAHDPNPPAVFIEQVRVNGRQYAVDDVPALEPGPGNLEFGYSALDYAAPQKIRYRYRLEGYQTEWVNAGTRRSAFYTNIKPGRYRFQVQACNSDKVWNLTGASLELKLPPRFYESLAFRIACATVILGFGAYFWWGWHLRRKQIQLQEANVLMEVRVRERTAELAQTNATLLSEIEQRKLAQSKSDALQDQLIKASRQAGQAEVASSVLHNVGNVLNSVNISTAMLGERLRGLSVNDLAKAADLVEEKPRHPGHPNAREDRAKALAVYLRRFVTYFAQEQESMQAELKDLTQNVEHIKEIVAMQQSYAKISGLLERALVADLVDTALKMHAGGYARHKIAVIREYEPVPEITVDKHRVLQILINIIQNAKYACSESQSEKKVVVRVQPCGERHIAISIADNGVGIAPENLTRVFSHGFTTRKDGHGFGLHSAALAAREMGGTINATSDGVGRGATFTLELPLSPPEQAHDD
jgi:ligand-binding sensor domain-containing protein/signal transduction histidine kinase